ncbi:MAG: hypothetical protein HGGPFJEG_01342 [Ignavibacteria bacterium]|nr:hypothetical protein [Ignavibacteria bacterium]
MYNSIEQFLKDWKYENESTLKILNNLTDESLKKKVTEDGRTLGFLAWHITQTIPEMMEKTGLNVDGPAIDQDVPDNTEKIKDAYKKAADSLAEQIKINWKDDILKIEDDMYGEKWQKGLTLMYLMLHQAHHRGQMTVLMRQAGLKVPGIYGPSSEEWKDMGMEPMK